MFELVDIGSLAAILLWSIICVLVGMLAAFRITVKQEEKLSFDSTGTVFASKKDKTLNNG